MKITLELLDRLTEEAKGSQRLRVNYDLRNSAEDGSQRMLNAIELGSVFPIHRHRKTSETMVCLRGKLVVEFYEEFAGGDGSPEPLVTDGSSQGKQGARLIETIELSPNGPVMALNIPAGQWHTVHSAESGTVILEMKDGPYEPLSEEDILK